MIITNSFSINMLDPRIEAANIHTERIDAAQARELVAYASWRPAIGHEDIARIAADILGTATLFRRETISWAGSEDILIVQYRGPRLAPGAVALPIGATIEWWLIDCQKCTVTFRRDFAELDQALATPDAISKIDMARRNI